MASKRSRSEMEEEECEKKYQAITLIRAAAKAASETVARDEFARVFTEAEWIIARHLEKKKPRNSSGDEQRQSGSISEGSSSVVGRNPEQNGQRGSSSLDHNLLELGDIEIEAERIRIATGIHRNFDWNPQTNTWMQRGLMANQPVQTIAPHKFLPPRPIPCRKFSSYDLPSADTLTLTLTRFRFVYHPCGLLVADAFPGGGYTPPMFRGEDHLDVAWFYKHSGIWLDREARVGPIEPQPNIGILARNGGIVGG
ncbi:hypothetical protein NHQ30_010334 [Ciborinia camelliae]|nr:hypothetical protein NHQ30_010334 [Ciborinia camelliae]